MNLNTILSSDFLRYGKPFSSSHWIAVFYKNPEYRFLLFLRLSVAFRFHNPIGFISRLFLKRLKWKYGIQIPILTKIGKGFHLNHFGGIVINQGVVLGEDCNVSQGVTLGNISRGKLKGCPTIGDRVWIGANSVIVGKITIGNDVLIGPLSFINFDIPNNAVVSGNPAKIINYNTSVGYSKNISE